MNNKQVYRLGKSYVDKGGTSNPDDQFLRWINIPGSGMLNAPGIRPLRYKEDPITSLPAYLILVTHEKSSGQLNPWDDLIDLSNASILYWGDAKRHDTRFLNDFRGNQVLRAIHDYILDGNRTHIPPILHFSKPKKGVVTFNGLCVLNKLETSWFDDHGEPVRNYQAHLTVLDCESVSVEWLHSRVKSGSLALDGNSNTPKVWKDYIKGRIRPIDIWTTRVRSETDQLPPSGTMEARILDQLLELDPFDFEKVIVAIFQALGDVTHHISGTKPTGDGGFDFFGMFKLPRPVDYEIHFRGEVKRYSRKTAVDPKTVSRLVARLTRQEYGIFVTTSYYTKQAQREVLADGYPIHLIAGADLVTMVKHLRITSKGLIRQDWINSVIGNESNLIEVECAKSPLGNPHHLPKPKRS